MWTKSFFALLVVGTVVNCVPTNEPTKEPTDRIDLPRAVSYFASDLYEQVARSKSGNVIISPLSVATSLALLSQAAEGRTYTELQHGLHLDGIDKNTVANQYHRFTEQLQRDIGGAEFSLANKIYVQQGNTLNRNFREVAMNKFRSGVETLNFKDAVKSAEIINRDVAKQTHDKIQKLVSSDSLSTNIDVFMVNAIYFKGKWEHQFNKEWTHKETFYTSEKQQIRTDFMRLQHKLNYVDSGELQASLVELKYADSKFSFVLAWPHNSTSLDQLAQRIKQIKLINVIRKMRPQEMTLSLPKFKVEYEIELKDVLKRLNMGTMLTNNADLRGIWEGRVNKNLVVSSVIHKAVIEIDESGSEASGSKGVGVASNAAPINELNVNSPFMYYIRDTEANTIVFSGHIVTVDRH